MNSYLFSLNSVVKNPIEIGVINSELPVDERNVGSGDISDMD